METLTVSPEEIQFQVENEIEQAESISDYFNNFHTHLNTGLTWDDYHQAAKTGVTSLNRRYMAVRFGLLDKPHKEPVISNHRFTAEDGFSQRFLDESPRQFYETLDEAVWESGISQEELMLLLTETRQIGSRENLYQRLTPAYIKLRTMGYNHADFAI